MNPNSTIPGLPGLNGYTARPTPKGNRTAMVCGTEPATAGTSREQERKNERTKRKERLRGDPLGEVIVTVFRAGESVVSAISSSVSWMLGPAHTDQAEAATDSNLPTEHPITNANAALAEEPGVNDALLLSEYMRDVASLALHSLMEAANWQIGPTGASAMPVTESAPGQCTIGPDGSQQCPKEIENAPLAKPSLSHISVAELKKACSSSFNVHISPSLQNRRDQSLSNVIIVIPDHDHYHTGMQQLINDALRAHFEPGDKLLVEWSADETPPPAYCRGVPPSHCVGIEDPVEFNRILKLGEASTDAARRAQNFIAKLAPEYVEPILSKDYGVVRSAFTDAYNKVKAGQIKVTGANIERLQELVAKLSAADVEFQKESRSPSSHAKRNAYMKTSMQSASLNGHKAFVVVGLGHIKVDRKLGVGLQDELLAEMDCVILQQKKFKDKDLTTAKW